MALIGYARFYQQIFELLPHEQPDDKVLENDGELDNWWTNFWNEKKREIAKSMNKQAKVPGKAASFQNLPTFKG